MLTMFLSLSLPQRKYDVKNKRCGFGVHEEEQINALLKMKEVIENMEFLNADGSPIRGGKLPFQHGILCSINSLLCLWQEWQMEGKDFLLTYRLNQAPWRIGSIRPPGSSWIEGNFLPLFSLCSWIEGNFSPCIQLL